MKSRAHAVVVEVKRSRSPQAGYTSKPGDARRSGRAQAGGGSRPVRIEFREGGQSIEVRLGVVTVGAVTHDVASKGYFWAVYLPGMPNTPKPARSVEAARDAIEHKVREWCEAALLISVRR